VPLFFRDEVVVLFFFLFQAWGRQEVLSFMPNASAVFFFEIRLFIPLVFSPQNWVFSSSPQISGKDSKRPFFGPPPHPPPPVVALGKTLSFFLRDADSSTATFSIFFRTLFPFFAPLPPSPRHPQEVFLFFSREEERSLFSR